jgi:hypothetical protein
MKVRLDFNHSVILRKAKVGIVRSRTKATELVKDASVNKMIHSDWNICFAAELKKGLNVCKEIEIKKTYHINISAGDLYD